MSCQLPADCLDEIFEYLSDDKVTLYSCLLVNHLYCKIAVRILWRDVCYLENNDRPHVPLSIISTLVACLPKETKDRFYRYETLNITPTHKPPLFNYASFLKTISIDKITNIIEVTSRYFKHPNSLLQELLKMFMNQISSLKYLDCCSNVFKSAEDIEFINSPEAKICLS